MKPKFTPQLPIAAIFVICLVAGSHGQSPIEPGVGVRTCSTANQASIQDPADNGAVVAPACEAKKDPPDLPKDNLIAKLFANPFGPKVGIVKTDWQAPGNSPQTQADNPQELAKKLSNPVASLISFPFQSNFDFGMGPERKGYRYTLNIQPVIPFALTKDINLITRTIFPVIAQNDVVGSTGQAGLGDTLQSFFFGPNKAEPFIWGVGPQVLIPTATNQYLGSQKFGMGPTFVILKQKKGWTAGALVNHTWSVFGKDSRPPVNSTFLQPFLSYTTKKAWTFSFNTESAYDWSGNQWNVPIHFQVSKLMKMGKQPVSVGIASRCWAVSGPGGPRGCGFRLVFVPLFPLK